VLRYLRVEVLEKIVHWSTYSSIHSSIVLNAAGN